MANLQVITNGEKWAIADVREGDTHPRIFQTYATKRKAMNGLKKWREFSPAMMEYWANSATGSLMGCYFSGRFEVVYV